MNLIQAHNQIVNVSDIKDINYKNYMDSLNYISNLYNVVEKIKAFLYLKPVEFLPTFKSRYIEADLGYPTTEEENTMKVFSLKSSLFSGDSSLASQIREELEDMCVVIEKQDDIIYFIIN